MPTSIKQALKKWEEATGKKTAEAREIKLIGVFPPIEKMEGPFHLLANLERFSLSTNQISTIANLQSFKNLKVDLSGPVTQCNTSLGRQSSIDTSWPLIQRILNPKLTSLHTDW